MIWGASESRGAPDLAKKTSRSACADRAVFFGKKDANQQVIVAWA
jgi:hypothetical protein